MRLTALLIVTAVLWSAAACWADDGDDLGFLCNPPIYIPSYPDFPLTGMGIEVPAEGVILPAGEISSMESDGWRQNGEEVQPGLHVELNTYRLGALRGFGDGWAAGVSIPWVRNPVRSSIGGFPAYGVGEGFGDVAFVGKKLLWQSESCFQVVGTFALETPTGKDDATFSQSNLATSGYYRGAAPRMPIGWQAGSGSWDGYLALAAGQRKGRMAYMGLVATKLHGTGDQDVKIGNMFVAEVDGTYGVTKNIAVSLGLGLRTQGDDSYPNSPLPVEGLVLRGTTTHGTTVFLTPSVRFRFANSITAGVSVSYPIVLPDDGMVPRVDFSLIFAPEF